MRKALRSRLGRVVAVTLDNGDGLAGRIVSVSVEELTLDEAAELQHDRPPRPIDGVVILPLARIAWLNAEE